MATYCEELLALSPFPTMLPKVFIGIVKIEEHTAVVESYNPEV